MKPLSQIIEEREPEFIDYDENCTSVCDRASYDRMKQIAVILAKACEEASYWLKTNDVNGFAGECCADTITKCRELLGEK